MSDYDPAGEPALVSNLAALMDDLADAMDTALTGGLAVPDYPGWRGPSPLRFENLVRILALSCVDSLRWSGRALSDRLSVVAVGAFRYLAETHVLLQWLEEPAAPEHRQKRAFEYMLAELEKSQQTAQAVLDRESDPAKKQWNADAIGIIDREKDLVRSLASAAGTADLGQVPKRRALFDRFRLPFGYAEFMQTSNLGGHPGLIYSRTVTRADGTAFVFQPAENLALRSYFMRSIAIEGFEIGRIACDANHLDTAGLRSLGDRFGPMDQAAKLAFYVDILSHKESMPDG